MAKIKITKATSLAELIAAADKGLERPETLETFDGNSGIMEGHPWGYVLAHDPAEVALLESIGMAEKATVHKIKFESTGADLSERVEANKNTTFFSSDIDNFELIPRTQQGSGRFLGLDFRMK